MPNPAAAYAQAPPPSLPSSAAPPAAVFSNSIVLAAVDSFPQGSSPSPSGLRPSHQLTAPSLPVPLSLLVPSPPARWPLGVRSQLTLFPSFVGQPSQPASRRTGAFILSPLVSFSVASSLNASYLLLSLRP